MYTTLSPTPSFGNPRVHLLIYPYALLPTYPTIENAPSNYVVPLLLDRGNSKTESNPPLFYYLSCLIHTYI